MDDGRFEVQDVWTDVSLKVTREAAIKVARLISGHEVRMLKLKAQNKSACVWEGARQGAHQCTTKKHDIRRQRHKQAKET